jgi:hypothetical protein
MHVYVYTPRYKYNLSCASLQLLWRLDTCVLVCGRTRRLSLSRSLSLARALALSDLFLVYSPTQAKAEAEAKRKEEEAALHKAAAEAKV